MLFPTFAVRMKQVDWLIRFIKDWTLLVCMAAGAVGFYILKDVEALAPLRHPASVTAHALLPILIFLLLFFTFVKIDFRSYRFARWHVVLAVLQTIISTAVALLVAHFPHWGGHIMAEGVFACIAVPSATAAAVIVRKLGGCVQTITTYTLLSGFVAALLLPLLIPIMEPGAHLSFLPFFLLILRRVTPTLVGPFVLALLIQVLLPRLARWIAVETKDVAFYMWGFNLIILIAQTINSAYQHNATGWVALGLVTAGLVVCIVQFIVGKRIGSFYGDRVACGQGFAQKNTSIAVWLSLSYFVPVSSVVPGSYILWQNVFNSWQLWKKRVANQSTSKQ